MKHLATLALSLFLQASAIAAAQQPDTRLMQETFKRDQQIRILEAAALDGRIWAIHADGSLKTYDAADGTPIATVAGDHYFMLSRHGSELWSLRWREFPAQNARHTVIVERQGPDGPVETSPLTFAVNEGIAAFVITDTGPVILTSAQMYRLAGGHWSATPLGNPQFRGLSRASALLPDGHTLYLGFDNGEWGGGLQRFDLGTRRLETIERRDSDALCSGPLNAACDPVTGVIADATHPGCVIVTVALSHLGMDIGNILHVCGSDVQLIFERPMPPPPPPPPGRQWIMYPSGTVPIYALAATSDGFWAMTEDHLFHFRDTHLIEDRDINLQEHGFLRLDRSVQGLLLVASLHSRVETRNFASDIGNTTPLLIQAP